MPENKLVDLSFGFAKSIVELVDTIKMPKSSYMVDQLARAGTWNNEKITKRPVSRQRKSADNYTTDR